MGTKQAGTATAAHRVCHSRQFSQLVLIAVLGCWFGLTEDRPTAAQNGAPATLHVSANNEQLNLEADGVSGLLQLLELAPQGSASPRPILEQPFTNSFRIALPRFDGNRDRLFSSFALRQVAPDHTTVPIGTNRFVEEFQGISRWQIAPPVAASKKGLQVQMAEDALALGVKQAALNVNLTGLVDLSDATNGPVWPVDGRLVRFQPGAVGALDRQIGPLTSSNVVISLILLTYASGDPKRDALMLHPRYDPRAPNHLGAFNTVTADGVLHLRACLEFLADRYSRPEFKGCVVNYILGNEVNSHWFWANMGRVTMEEFAEDYLRTARLAATALRNVSSSARLFLSLEHHWNMRYAGGDAGQAFAGRSFLDYFARRAREHGDFEWHLAFHPYPENLFEPRTWKDRSATMDEQTPRITFKNLEMLPRYLQRPELLWRGQPRHVLLSEQGFHTVNRPEGELWQAAAYAYAYYKCTQLPGIDAFILHRHVDHRDEGGLNLGLWTRRADGRSAADPERPKKIYEVFKAADTPAWEQHFQFALPVIGIKSWTDVWSSPAAAAISQPQAVP